MNRRQFLTGLSGILAAGVAPAIITQGVLMPVRKIWVPQWAGMNVTRIGPGDYIVFFGGGHSDFEGSTEYEVVLASLGAATS